MSSWFQSPYGDYLVRNPKSIGNPKLLEMFQSPYGDYLVRNFPYVNLGTAYFIKISFSPLTGIT